MTRPSVEKPGQMRRGYRGYDRREVPPEDAELTHVGPGTPCGEYMRRFWQPVTMTDELGDLPLAVRLLGEDLVVFRDLSGRLGLLHRHCSHRGASLEFAIPMARGISCCYHGWTYDIDGTLLDTPGEPAGSPLTDEVVHGAYPVHEHDGLIFAYLGPPDQCPPFPEFDTYGLPDTEAVPFSLTTPCNWLQVYENTQDPVHTVFLHTRMSGAQFGAAWGEMQVVDYRPTPLGMINIQTRRWNDLLWNRTTETILPNGNQTGAIWEQVEEEKVFRRVAITRWMVPVDDTTTRTIGWRIFSDLLDPAGAGDRSCVGKEKIEFLGQIEDRDYEARQRRPGDYEAQVSQRPIAVHALEHLGSSDRGVVMLRKLVRDGIRRVAGGEPAVVPMAADGGRIATYCQDTIWRVPPPGDGDDRGLLKDFGRAIADAVLRDAHLSEQARAEGLRDLCRARFCAAPAGE
jgi:phenylpropionate dioxygenase-like ring-hydroxylating dioxygenase large terminal subunit